VKSLGWKIWNVFTSAHVAAYRATGGRIGRKFRGAPVLLLDHVGRKTGQKRTIPLMYLRDGDDLVIVASKGGSHKHPLWWLNLRDHPRTTVMVDSETRAVTARQASTEEKQRLWPRLVEIYKPYDDYQQRTSRDIPVVILERGG
jgi:deazaflavin-dependent oxidoreductase (nitroreductase family)